MEIALIGAGQRGNIYASYLTEMGIQICAVVEPREERREAAAKAHHIPHSFACLEDFLQQGKMADAAIIATMDRDHYSCAIPLLKLGYDLLLEKPISPDSRECVEIQKVANAQGCKVLVCHVLRYTGFFATIQKLLQSSNLGKVRSIEYAEYMGNFHMAHSFVRGKWNNSETSSPIILQKSCHDMDILTWLAGSPARKVSSFGGLSYFKADNAPEGSAERCKDCSLGASCRFNAYRTYLPMIGQWRSVDVTEDLTEDGMRHAIETGPYGRCVFHCDNNVCDHQTTSIEFENGVTATFQMSAFSDSMHRRIKVMCDDGAVYGDDSEDFLKVTRFASFADVPSQTTTIKLPPYRGRHGGGDLGIVKAFVEMLENGPISGTCNRSLIAESIESHLIANAAELSRLTGQTVEMKEYRKTLADAE